MAQCLGHTTYTPLLMNELYVGACLFQIFRDELFSILNIVLAEVVLTHLRTGTNHLTNPPTTVEDAEAATVNNNVYVD